MPPKKDRLAGMDKIVHVDKDDNDMSASIISHEVSGVKIKDDFLNVNVVGAMGGLRSQKTML